MKLAQRRRTAILVAVAPIVASFVAVLGMLPAIGAVTSGAARAELTSVSVGSASASDKVVPIHWAAFAPYPTDPDSDRVRSILLNSTRYGLTTWYNQRYGSQTGAYLDLGGTAETNVRQPAEEALGLATSIASGAYDPAVVGVPLADATSVTVRIIDSVAYHHDSNTVGGWGDDWQTAYWAYADGYAGWLMWDKLSPTGQAMVQNMVEHEADRFIDYQVPYYRDEQGNIVSPGDTKAEENAWNANVLELATAMMPSHPHWNSWMDKALELMVSSFSRPSNVGSSRIINGKPLSMWLHGSNINEDGTLVNHGIIHPDYMAANGENDDAAATYTLAGMKAPQAAFFNSDSVYDALANDSFPSPPYDAPGGTIYVPGSSSLYYPQGDDWGTSRVANFAALDIQARAYGFDSSATIKADVWEGLHATRELDMQERFPDGRTYGAASEDTYPGREQWVAANAAQMYLTKWTANQPAFGVTNRPYDVDPTLATTGSDDFMPGQAKQVTVTFTNNERVPLNKIQLGLAAPAGWQTSATGPTAFDEVGSFQSVQTTYDVVAPTSASTHLAALNTTASFYRRSDPQTIKHSSDVLIGPDIALNKPVTGFSSQYPSPTWYAKNIDDGQVNAQSRGWAGLGQNQWVTIDLGQAYSISALRITGEDVADNRNVKDFILYGSNTGAFDGEEFVINSGTVPPLAHLQTWTTTFQPKTARYVKFLGVTSYSQYTIVGELELYQ